MKCADTLIVAARDHHSKHPLEPRTFKELRRVFNNPSHVLRVRLNPDNPACHNLNVAFHATFSATTARPVILWHEQCFVSGKMGELGPADFRAELEGQGFEVIDISDEDLWNLAASAVSNPNDLGWFLMTRPVSEPLYHRLLAAGVRPEYPGGNIPVGFNGKGRIPIFGLRCMTLNFQVPIRRQDPERARNREEQEGKTGRAEHVLILRPEDPTLFGWSFAKDALEEQFGDDRLDVVDIPPQGYPFPRNLFAARPQGGVVTTREIPDDERIHATRGAMLEYFDSKDIPVEIIPGFINFADVELVGPDALIVATRDSPNDRLKPPLHPETMTALQRVLGNPSHVLRVRLDPRNPACYDLDVAFHATFSAKTGKPVVLWHENCFVAGKKKGELGPAEFRAELVAQGFEVIDVSEEDLWNLAANSVTNPHELGWVLMTRQISEALHRKLIELGVEPVFPRGDILVGFNEPNQMSIFGLHCMTLNFHVPARPQEAKEGL